jgi:hypothetical protein
MEEVLCAMALKSAIGRQNRHTLSGLRVCCERALKSAGERNTHGGRCGGLRETARTGDFGSNRSRIQWLFGGGGYGVLPCWRSDGCAARSSLRSRRPSGP